MLEPLQIQDVSIWLIHAAYYNNLWHQCDNFLRTSPLPELNKTENSYHKSQRTLLLNQKQNCQLTALRLTYSESQLNEYSEHDLILIIDPYEKGMNGDGIFYSLYVRQHPDRKCHIPHNVLLENLTTKELVFFNIESFV